MLNFVFVSLCIDGNLEFQINANIFYPGKVPTGNRTRRAEQVIVNNSLDITSFALISRALVLLVK